MVTGVIQTNTMALLLGRFTSAATSFVIAILAARSLGEEFGTFAAIVAAGFIANTVITFGTDTLIVRATSRDPNGTGSDLAAPILALQLAASVVVSVAAGTAWFANVASVALAIQALVLLPQAVTAVSSAILRGRQQMTKLTISSAIGGIVGVVVTAVLFDGRSEVWVPVVGLGAGHVVTALLTAVQARVRFRLPASIHEIRSLATVTWAFAVMVGATTVSSQISLVVLGGFGAAGAAGFAIAMRFVEAARLLPASAYGAAFPAMADRLHLRASYLAWSKRLIYYGAVATVILIALARPLSDAVFGPIDYGPESLRILALSIVPIILRMRRSFELIADGYETRVAIASVATATFITLGALLTLSATSAADGVGEGGTAVTVIAWLHVVAIMLNVAILEGVTRRSLSSPSEIVLPADRSR